MITNIADVKADIKLAALLDGKVKVNTSATESHAVKCYADNGVPNKGVDDEFISVLCNGPTRSRTKSLGLFKGNLALIIYCRLQTDNRVKRNRVDQMVGECQKLIDEKTKDGIFFTIDPSAVITPTYADTSIGYSKTTINVEWETIS